ncbi:MAG TPA: GDP-L-fucose synthase [Burkholderiales bacterium]|nr:GDP-L-fucose synthase [Burkholderiales bacterium]
MKTDDKIYVAGHTGLAGAAIVRRLRAGGYTGIVTRTHAELDLTDAAAVQAFFNNEKPDHVFLAAAKVGGILANSTRPAEFIYENLAIQTNAIEASRRAGVKKLMFLGSSCIYPKHAPQPMKEEHLLSGQLEPTNEPYAVAKIAGIKMCAAYNRQYGTDYLAAMPTNLYGPGDRYDLQNGHVAAALMRRMYEAKAGNAPSVTIWGTGTPRREFLHSDDFADAIVFLMERFSARDLGEFINVGTGKDVTIAELAAEIAAVVGFRGELVYDRSKPDGTPRKLLDVSRLARLGWTARTSLKEGLARTYEHFRETCENRRPAKEPE